MMTYVGARVLHHRRAHLAGERALALEVEFCAATPTFVERAASAAVASDVNGGATHDLDARRCPSRSAPSSRT